MTHALHFIAADTLPAVYRAARADREPDTGPIRPAELGGMEWGALRVAKLVNGCGPTSWPDLIPDLTPAISAGGYLHDLGYLAGGTDADRDKADLKFSRTAPACYAEAVHRHGSAFFAYRPKPLTHGELCLIIQGAFLAYGYEACAKAAPDIAVMRELERLTQTTTS